MSPARVRDSARRWEGREPRLAHRGFRPSRGRRQSGFSLLELLVAFVVFALAFSALMQITVGSVRSARRAADYTHAALWAQAKLDELGVGASLKDGGERGRFDDRYEWELEVRKEEPPPPLEGGVQELVPVDLFRLALTVRWRDGETPREATFVTLRARQPDAGVAP
jgi:general secretion pathway protein I